MIMQWWKEQSRCTSWWIKCVSYPHGRSSHQKDESEMIHAPVIHWRLVAERERERSKVGESESFEWMKGTALFSDEADLYAHHDSKDRFSYDEDDDDHLLIIIYLLPHQNPNDDPKQTSSSELWVFIQNHKTWKENRNTKISHKHQYAHWSPWWRWRVREEQNDWSQSVFWGHTFYYSSSTSVVTLDTCDLWWYISTSWSCIVYFSDEITYGDDGPTGHCLPSSRGDQNEKDEENVKNTFLDP